MFDDVIAANQRYADTFHLSSLPAKAARELAVVTCIDSRIEPLAMLGLEPGDAKILRNAGGRVTDDVLRSLIIATNLLSVRRIAVIHHTGCAMVTTEADMSAAISAAAAEDAPGHAWHAITDPDADLAADVERVRTCGLVSNATVVGWRYDIATGLVHEVVA
jgi:carbonic anhydrase